MSKAVRIINQTFEKLGTPDTSPSWASYELPALNDLAEI